MNIGVLFCKRKRRQEHLNIQIWALLLSVTLSHANADSERGLSINKRILGTERTPLSGDSINGIRACKDAVESVGGQPQDIPITRALIGACRSANQSYMLKRRSEKEAEDKKKADENLKKADDMLAAAAADRKSV